LKFRREVKLDSGRIDYLLELTVGLEVKSPYELVHNPAKILHQLKDYARGVDYLVLLINDHPEKAEDLSSLVKASLRELPENVAIAVGFEHNPLSWRAVFGEDVVQVVKRALAGVEA